MVPSDEELARRAAAGDGRRAFAMLVSRHQSDVRRTLRRLTRGNLALADDLAQESFVKAWRSIGDFRGDSSFRTWMFRIAYRSFLSEIRRRRGVAKTLHTNRNAIHPNIFMPSELRRRFNRHPNS